MPRKLWAALRRLLVRLGLLRPGKIMYIGGSDRSEEHTSELQSQR